jgi:hypothetical protein
MIDPYKDKVGFGKYADKTYYDVAEIDPSYILWVKDNVKGVNLPVDFTDAVEWDLMEEEEEYLSQWDHIT